MAHILIIEDDATTRRAMAMYLTRQGYAVTEAPDGESGLLLFRQIPPDAVLCDLRLPGISGEEVIKTIAVKAPEIPLIVVSGSTEAERAIEVLKNGAWDYLLKPLQEYSLLATALSRALERARLLSENRAYRERIEETLLQLEDDETTAREIQLQMLPSPSLRFEEIECRRLLRTSAFLSGDFVGYFPVTPTHLAFYIADVSGHGVSSAFITVLLHSAMGHLQHAHTREGDETLLHPTAVMTMLNKEIRANDYGKYLTMIYGVIDIASNQLTLANAGHFPHPILWDGVESRYLVEHGLPVGLFPGAEWSEITLPLPERYMLVFFSDGALPVLPPGPMTVKTESLKTLVHGGATIESITWAMGLASKARLEDDFTVMTIGRTGA